MKHIKKFSEINELKKTTWDSAYKKASERGYDKLANKFREHGREFGQTDSKNEFEMVFDTKKGTNTNLKLRLISLEISTSWRNSYDMQVEDENGNNHYIAISMDGNKPKFFLNKEFIGLALNRKEAKKLLNILKENGVKEIDNNSDTRSISYEDVEF